MAGRGVTVFVTTHYMDEAEYCDRLALIDEGKIIALGTPAELKTGHMPEAVWELETDRLIEAMGFLRAESGTGSRTALEASRGLRQHPSRGDRQGTQILSSSLPAT